MDILKIAKKNAEISGFTYFGLKGKVAYLIETESPTELQSVVMEARRIKIPYFIIAGGSNIVLSDKKYTGLVIIYSETGKVIKPDSIIRKDNRLLVWGSVSLERVIKYSIANGLAGLESLSGIPGNLSGAIYGNAGAYGHSISEVVEKVLVFDGKKDVWLSKKDCHFSYRESVFKKKKWVILSVKLKLRVGRREKLRATSDLIIKKRAEKYANIKCPGSFFKNVLVEKITKKTLAKVDPSKIIDGKIPAGYLLEAVGAKGLRIGGLYIADYHGNLLINDGHATYREVRKLVELLKERVLKKFGIKLEEEVQYLI